MQSILDAITEWIKEILIGAINGNLSTMFGDVNEKVGTIAAEVGQTPQGWNAGIFSMIRSLSENVIVPIAGLVITYVLCVELISMVTERTICTTMYANSEDFQVLAITTMVSSFVAEWNDPNMKLHHEWKVVPSRPLSVRSEQSNGKARGQLLKFKLNISERAAPVNFGSMKSAARFSLF